MLEILIFFFFQKNKRTRPCSHNASILAGISTLSWCHYISHSSSGVFPKVRCPCCEQSTAQNSMKTVFSVLFPKSFWWSLASPILCNLQQQVGQHWKYFWSPFLGFPTKTSSYDSSIIFPLITVSYLSTKKLTCKKNFWRLTYPRTVSLEYIPIG